MKKRIIFLSLLLLMFTVGAIAQVTLTIPAVQAPAAGAAVTMPINVTNFTNVGAITLKVIYDTAVVTYTGIANAPTGVTFTVGSGTPGVINLGWFDATGNTPISITSGKLVDLNFTYKKGTSTIGFTASACDIANGSGASITGIVYTNGSLLSSTTTSLTIPTVQAPAAVGGAVTMPIVVSNFTNVGAITLKITYDPSVMVYTGIANAPTGVTFTVGSGTPGVINLGWFDATGNTPISIASGKLVDLNFTYSGGSSKVGFTSSACDIANGSGTSITGIVYTNGMLQSSGGTTTTTLTIPNVQAPAAGGAVIMPINVSNFTNVGAITLKVTYDTAVVTYTGIANAPTGVTFTVGSGTPGVINLGWFDATGNTPISITSGKLVDLNFTYKKGASTIGFTASACDIANGSGTSLPGIVYTNGSLFIAAASPTLTIPTVQAPGAVGGTVTIPINVANFTNVGAITLKITYDPAVVTFMNVANAPTGVTFTVGSGTAGVINLGWFDATGNTPLNIATGKLIDLNFTYIGGTSTVGFTTSACDIAGSSGTSMTSVYTNGSVLGIATPVVPILQTPATGSTNQPVSLTLTWGSVSGAATYRVQVATDSLFATLPLVVDDSTLTTNSRAVGPLLNNTTYYWRVNAKNAGGTSLYSAKFNFTTIVAIPAVPVLQAPANGAINQQTTITLTWSAVTGATTYGLLFASDSLFNTVVLNDTNIVTNTRVVKPLVLSTKYYWKVYAKNIAGKSNYSAVFNFTTGATGVEILGELPKEFTLSQNYPNPFNPSTTIQFGLPNTCNVTLKVYNMLGEEVASVVNETMTAGYHTVVFDGAKLTSGMYLYRITAGNFVQVNKMMMLK
ncbi:MAG: cohesin domain-containing protein [Bacteroidota bacterium]